MTTSTTDRLLTEREAAEVLGLQPATLRTWRSRGDQHQPECIRIGRRAVRYRLSDLTEYMAGLTAGEDR